MRYVIFALLSIWLACNDNDSEPIVYETGCCEFSGYACNSSSLTDEARCVDVLQGEWIPGATCSIGTGNCELSQG